MSKPRILTVSDWVEAPTGFGRQHQIMADALAATGKYEVVSIGIWHNGRAKQRKAGEHAYWCYPAGDGTDACTGALAAQWPQIVRTWGPDIVIALGDIRMFTCISDMPTRPFDWIHWLPVDAEPYPQQHDGIIRKMDHLVLMSQFGERVVRPHVEGRVRLSNIGIISRPGPIISLPRHKPVAEEHPRASEDDAAPPDGHRAHPPLLGDGCGRERRMGLAVLSEERLRRR